MTGVGRGRAAEEEMVVLLAVVRLERFVLRAVFELGADSQRCGGVESGKGERPCNHRVCEGHFWPRKVQIEKQKGAKDSKQKHLRMQDQTMNAL